MENYLVVRKLLSPVVLLVVSFIENTSSKQSDFDKYSQQESKDYRLNPSYININMDNSTGVMFCSVIAILLALFIYHTERKLDNMKALLVLEMERKVAEMKNLFETEIKRKLTEMKDLLKSETENRMTDMMDLLKSETENKMSEMKDLSKLETEQKLAEMKDLLKSETKTKLTEMKDLLKSETEKKLTEMKDSLKLDTARKVAEIQLETKEKSQYFTATLSRGTNVRLERRQILKFDKVYLDKGSGYDPTNGHYTINKSGFYLVSCTVRSIGNCPIFWLCKDHNRIAPADGISGRTGTLTVALRLQERNKLYIEHEDGDPVDVQAGDATMFTIVFLSD